MEVIDVHLHPYKNPEEGKKAFQGLTSNQKYFGTIEELLPLMKKGNISHVVMLLFTPTANMLESAISKLESGLSAFELNIATKRIKQQVLDRLYRRNNWGCSMARQYPQLLPFIGLDPFLMDAETLEKEIEDKVCRQGARGIKIVPALQHFYPNDRIMWPVYRKAETLEIPVLSQSGGIEDSGVQYGEPRYFEDVLANFPKLKVILAHMGIGFEHQVIELTSRYANIYSDLSVQLSRINQEQGVTLEEMAELIRKIGTDRVMFGSNWPMFDTLEHLNIFGRLPLSLSEKEAILRNNARHVLRLD